MTHELISWRLVIRSLKLMLKLMETCIKSLLLKNFQGTFNIELNNEGIILYARPVSVITHPLMYGTTHEHNALST